MNECEEDILKLLRTEPLPFNAICLKLPKYNREIIKTALLHLSSCYKIKDSLEQSTFETEMRWIRIYRIRK